MANFDLCDIFLLFVFVGQGDLQKNCPKERLQQEKDVRELNRQRSHAENSRRKAKYKTP